MIWFFRVWWPALDLALGLRVVRRAAYVGDALAVEPPREVACDVGGSVVAEQPWAVHDPCGVAARGCKGEVQRVGNVAGAHGRAELPGDDVVAQDVTLPGLIESILDGRQRGRHGGAGAPRTPVSCCLAVWSRDEMVWMNSEAVRL